MPTERNVSVEGPVTKIEQLSKQLCRQVAGRYLPAEQVDGCRKYSESYGEQIAVHVSSELWLSADLGNSENWT